MAIPDPYVNERFILAHVARMATDPTEPSDVPPYGEKSDSSLFPGSCYLAYRCYDGLHSSAPISSGEIQIAGTDKEVDNFIKAINDEYLSNGGIIVGCHLKNVLFRTAWWYHLRTRLPLPEFARLSQNIDIADKFNGPAILTAEERYSFRTDTACKLLGYSVEGDALDQIWFLCKKLMEYKA